MLARYPATCRVCSRAIAVGDEIESTRIDGRQVWVHAACRGGEQASTLPLEAPEESLLDVPAPAVDDSRTTVYTDGSCLRNPAGPGGWAWAVSADHHDSGPDPSTTNQRMEITAAFRAVQSLTGPLLVVSDSRYVVNCFQDEWWRGWLARGWVSSAKKPVANRDLWEPFIALVRERGDVSFQWVKGHSGHVMNDLVDSLAVAAARSVEG